MALMLVIFAGYAVGLLIAAASFSVRAWRYQRGAAPRRLFLILRWLSCGALLLGGIGCAYLAAGTLQAMLDIF